MPRRSGGSSRSSSPNRSSYSQQAPVKTPVQTQARPTPTPTPTQTTGSGMGSGLLGTMAQGMAFGAGSEVAHQAMRSMFGGGSHAQQPTQAQPQEGAYPEQQQQNLPKYCETENVDFVNCLKTNSTTITYCQPYLDMLKECEKRISKEKSSNW